MILGLSPIYIVLIFFIYSIAGWIFESTFKSIRSKRLVNRGFLIGPIIPIYGVGATLVYMLVRPFSNHPTLIYIVGILIATSAEYITSWLLQVIFKAQWWDYSKEPYNLQGRIALIPSLFWGFLSIVLFDFLQPGVDYIINIIPSKQHYSVAVALSIALVCDLTYTVITTLNFRKQLENLYRFRSELEGLIKEAPFAPVKDMLSTTTAQLSQIISNIGFTQRMEQILDKLSILKNSNDDTRLSSLEERFKKFGDHRNRFVHKGTFTGNLRILNAFPTMKFTPKNSPSISVRELILNLKKNLKR